MTQINSLTWFAPCLTDRKVIGRLGGSTCKPLRVECNGGLEFAVKFPHEDFNPDLMVNEFVSGLLLRRLGLHSPAIASVVLDPQVEWARGVMPRPVEQAALARWKPLTCVGTAYIPDTSQLPAKAPSTSTGHTSHLRSSMAVRRRRSISSDSVCELVHHLRVGVHLCQGLQVGVFPTAEERWGSFWPLSRHGSLSPPC